jgi:VCBS repeat-containing protein
LPENASLDEFEGMEGLSGSHFDDVLKGTHDLAADRLPTAQGGTSGYKGSLLDADGIARIAGLQTLLGAGVTSLADGDIILGGGGSDLITGNGGNDIIDGDQWLNVRISVRANADGTGAEIDSADSMRELVTEMFNGTYNPGQLVIVREILDGGSAGDVDTAVFSDLIENYDILYNGDGSVTVVHARGTMTDGTDRVRNVELLAFANDVVDLTQPIVGLANNDTFVIDENDTLSGNLFGDNGFGSDDALGGPPLAIAEVNGLALNLGTTIELESGALLTVNADGSFDYDPDGSFDETPLPSTGASNTPATDTFSYALSGGATAVVTITLNGLDSDDVILGTDGADVLTPDGGTDEVQGGLGDDTYVINNSGHLVVEAANEGFDQIIASVSYVLAASSDIESMATSDAAAATPINLTGNNVAQTLEGNAGANVLDGGGGSDQLFGNGGADVLIGGNGKDNLWGGAGNDTLDGGVGIDRLDGGAGADTMIGGAGHDMYTVSDAGDLVIEAAGGGYDTVSSTLANYTLAAQVEDLILAGGGNITGRGNGMSNRLFGNSGNNNLVGNGGNDQLEGGAGMDNLWGGIGADVLIGGAGADAFRFDTALGAGNVDTIQDYNTASERIGLHASIFTGSGGNGTLAAARFKLTTSPLDANDRIIYNQATGNIYFDRDGSGSAAAILFASVSDGTVLNNADFFIYGA